MQGIKKWPQLGEEPLQADLERGWDLPGSRQRKKALSATLSGCSGGHEERERSG